jgi:quercetin dioxygenase-like cupin family protein
VEDNTAKNQKGGTDGMATRDFEVRQLLKAYRKGLISDEVFAAQMQDVEESQGGLNVVNVLGHHGDGAKVSARKLQKTAQSETVVFTIPAHFHADRENTHTGDQLIYIIDGTVTARVSGREQDLKAGDLLLIPAGAPHTLRTGSEPMFGFTVFAPPEA